MIFLIGVELRHNLDPENPIEIMIKGSSGTIPNIAGGTYNIMGINVVVSEVYDDYVVLLVEPL